MGKPLGQTQGVHLEQVHRLDNVTIAIVSTDPTANGKFLTGDVRGGNPFGSEEVDGLESTAVGLVEPFVVVLTPQMRSHQDKSK